MNSSQRVDQGVNKRVKEVEASRLGNEGARLEHFPYIEESSLTRERSGKHMRSKSLKNP